MKQGTWQVPVFTLGLLMGTASTLVMKAVYESKGVDSYGVTRNFEKPLFLTFTMFCGMLLALPLHYLVIYFSKRKAANSKSKESTPLHKSETKALINNQYNQQALNDILGENKSSYQKVYPDDFIPTSSQDEEDDTEEEESHVLDDPRSLLDLRLNLILFIPSFFDLLGTALSSIGLLYTSVSVYQLSRCTVIIVTALLKAFVLNHALSANMWAGVIINAMAMAFVGSTAFFEPTAAEGPIVPSAHSDPRIGILFILASCLVQGSQYVFEEKVMSYDNVPPLILVGMEGFWGVMLFLSVVFPITNALPGLDNGRYEDFVDSLKFCFSNPTILALVLSFLFIVFLYNVFCIYITYLLNSVWHAIMDNCRPVAVWIAGLALYYSIGKVGEPWTNSSWLELIGMVLLFYGTAVYNGNIQFFGLSKSDTQPVEYEEAVIGHYNPNPSTPMFRPGTPKMEHLPHHTPSHSALHRIPNPTLNGRFTDSIDHAAILTQSPALLPRSSGYSNIGHESI